MVAPWITVEQTAFPNSDYAQTAVDYATFILYKLTGEKYPGAIKTIESYVRETNRPSRDALIGGREVSIDNAVSVPSRVSYPQRLYLRGAPVVEVHSVLQGGVELDPQEYTLYNRKFLKLNSRSNWDYACGMGGITVEYTYGMLPPNAGVLAATTLANELLILMGEGSSGNECRIPERVRSISREGISFDMIDPQEFMDDGRTGIWEIDLFIRTANPARSKKQPRIISPHDARRYR